MRRRFILALCLLLATASGAHADPISAIVALGSAIAGAFSITSIVSTLLGFGFSIVSSLLAKAKKGEISGVKSDIDVGGDKPRSFVMGHYATAGHLIYANTRGSAQNGDVKNAYLTQVIAVGDLPRQKMTGLWIYDTKIDITGFANPNDNDSGWPVREYFGDETHNALWIRYHDGTQTAQDPYLARFAGDEEYPFPADCVGHGVPYLVVTAQYDAKLFSGRPEALTETDGIPLYDPRKDTSVGGNGPQRWADDTTWAPSSNPIVQIYNVIRGIRYKGEWVWGGQTIGAFQLPLANWMTGMNVCDAAIANADNTTEPQFRSGLEVSFDQEPADVIENILKGCNGRMAEIGGIYKISVGAPGAPVWSFSDASIVVTESQELDPFPGLQDTTNGASASYPEPGEKWTVKEAPPFYRSDLEALDDNRRLVSELRYPYTPYARQVQRLIKTAIEDARRFRQHQLTLPPEAWMLEPLDVVAWTSARNGYSNKKFFVTESQGSSAFLQRVGLKEIDPADYSWSPATDEKPVDFGFLGEVRPTPQVLSGWQVAGASILDASGNRRRPTIKVFYDGGQIDVDELRIQVRLAATDELMFDATMAYDAPTPEQYSLLLNGVFQGDTGYEARGVYRSYSGRPFIWSDWLTVVTPAEDLGLPPAKLERAVQDMVLDARRSIEDVAAQIQALAKAIALTTGRQLLDLGGVSARLIDEGEARKSDNLATARRITGVETGIADARSGVAAVSAATQVLSSRTEATESGLRTNASAITGALARLDVVDTKNSGQDAALTAQAGAISALDAEVENQNGDIAALGQAIVAANARVGEVDAAGLFKIEARAGQSGSVSIYLMARVSTQQAFKEVGLLMRATENSAIVAMIAEQIVFGDGATLAGVRAAADLGASDPAARINSGATVTINGGRLTAESVGAVAVAARSIDTQKLTLNGVALENILEGAASGGGYVEASFAFAAGNDNAPQRSSLSLSVPRRFVEILWESRPDVIPSDLEREIRIFRGPLLLRSYVEASANRIQAFLFDSPGPGVHTYAIEVLHRYSRNTSQSTVSMSIKNLRS